MKDHSETEIALGTRTPVRIYVLWHAEMEGGLELARHIYHWFRLPTGEGIPVYFRCYGSENEALKENIPEIYPGCDHNIVIPLIDFHMVASFTWRTYLQKQLTPANDDQLNAAHQARTYALPVAIDDTAYQIPGALNRLNFIRYESDQSKNRGETRPDELLLTRLTEAICLRLREAIYRRHHPANNFGKPDPIKIFLSHAKADGIEVPRLIKNFISSETQCQSFFDENDIAYGHNFGDVIEESLSEDSAGLLVIQGDHYADRPWCRKEIRDFLNPVEQPPLADHPGKPPIFSSMPVVMVSNLAGQKIARTIPELGHASCLQWKPGAERLAVVTLLREILFSNFYRLLAERTALLSPERMTNPALIINRPPDPVLIEEVRRVYREKNGEIENDLTIHHPGHGLTSIEVKGLKQLYPRLNFCAFGSTAWNEVTADSLDHSPLAGKVIAVSVGNSPDILRQGIGDDHTVELIRAIFRPFFRQQISLLYAGALPNHDRPPEPWKQERVNFTQVFLELLLSERSEKNSALPEDHELSPEEELRHHPRLINLSYWPHTRAIDSSTEAQWINTCSFIKINPEDARVPHEDREELEEKSRQQNERFKPADDTKSTRLARLICGTHARRLACSDEVTCSLIQNQSLSFKTHAHVFIGGKLTEFSGLMPGIWEEALAAFEAKRPCFILGVARGAAGQLARWLLDPPVERPRELTYDRCNFPKDTPQGDSEEILQNNNNDWLSSKAALDQLWKHIKSVRKKSPDDDENLAKLLNNNLDSAENRELMTESSFHRISQMIASGL